MNAFVIFGIGMLLGSIVTQAIFWSRRVGNLRIDTSDPNDGPYLFLELDKDVGALFKKSHVVLRVKIKNYISHE